VSALCLQSSYGRRRGAIDTDTLGLIVLLIALVALFVAARWRRCTEPDS